MQSLPRQCWAIRVMSDSVAWVATGTPVHESEICPLACKVTTDSSTIMIPLPSGLGRGGPATSGENIYRKQQINRADDELLSVNFCRHVVPLGNWTRLLFQDRPS